MIDKKMENGINDQITFEIYSAHLYLSMAAYLDSIDLPGFSHWMRIQYQEEIAHSFKMFDYVVERDGRAKICQIDEPQFEWDSVLDAFESAFAHEQMVTKRINNLVDIALAEKDHASHIFLQWFVNEQVEEEATAKGIIQQLKMLADSKAGLFQIDRELGQRVFTPPV